ncbi:MAG: PDZ domain-containing protein [Acidobacteria bacterium]|jgi:hypothetical protein|nr:PDZ domain-containing protein [Acidobacteriota bacterium]
MSQSRTHHFREAAWKLLLLAAALCACLGTGMAQVQAPPPSIWPPIANGQWFWIAPRTDLAAAEIEAVFQRMVVEQTAYLDAKFGVSVFFAKKVRFSAGKAKKRKEYAEQPGKADDLRIEAEWQTGYLNQYRGQTYTFIALDAVRGLGLHYLPRPGERFPKAPAGRNWIVNVLAGTPYTFFFSLEDSARAFINALASAVRQRGLELELSRFGLMWENVTPAQAAEMGRPAGGGVLVTMVAFGGPGDHAGVRPLDAVLAVNGVEVKNFSHFSLLLEAIPAGSKASLLLLRRLRPPDSDPEPCPWDTLTVEIEAR